MAKRVTRGYSRAYPEGENPGKYLVVAPAPLWRKVKAKSKREGVAIRSVILAYLDRWVAEPAPPKES